MTIKNWIRFQLYKFLAPDIAHNIEGMVRTSTYNMLSSYENDKKEVRAYMSSVSDHLRSIQASEATYQKRHEEQMTVLKEIAQAIRDSKAQTNP